MRNDVPDDPIIAALERDGVPPWFTDPPIPICPICNGEAETYYLDKYREIVGCNLCIKQEDAVDYTEKHLEGNQ